MYNSIARILPPRFADALRHLDNKTEEIRLRVGFRPFVVSGGKEYMISGNVPEVLSSDLDAVVSAASEGSVYTSAETMRSGYIPLPNGHRIGICGDAVVECGEIRTFRNLSSLSIRLASQRKCIGVPLHHSTLILGPPGSGKTTLLRDCIRILSDELGQRVSLVDERCEIAACREGTMQLYCGKHTDVLSGARKAEGMLMMLRTMNPQWIAVDEITRQEDIEAMDQAAYCGVRLVATVHANQREDLEKRPVFRSLLQNNVFRTFLILRGDHVYTMEEVLTA